MSATVPRKDFPKGVFSCFDNWFMFLWSAFVPCGYCCMQGLQTKVYTDDKKEGIGAF